MQIDNFWENFEKTMEAMETIVKKQQEYADKLIEETLKNRDWSKQPKKYKITIFESND